MSISLQNKATQSQRIMIIYVQSSGVAMVMKLGGTTSTEGARFLAGEGWGPAPPRIFFSSISKTLFLAFSGRFIDNLKATHR